MTHSEDVSIVMSLVVKSIVKTLEHNLLQNTIAFKRIFSEEQKFVFVYFLESQYFLKREPETSL